MLYQEAAEAASQIAMSSSLEAAASARQSFWELYWGKLSMLEHKAVEQAMKSFGDRLGQCEAGEGKPCFGEQNGSVPTDLRGRSYDLAHCLRFSLMETWKPGGLRRLEKSLPLR